MVDLPGASLSKKTVSFSLRSHEASVASQLRVQALESLLRLSYVSEEGELICGANVALVLALSFSGCDVLLHRQGRTRLNMLCSSLRGITVRRLCQGPVLLSH